METGEIYEEVRQKYKHDEEIIRKIGVLKQMSVDEVMNMVAMSNQRISMFRSCLEKARLIRNQAEKRKEDREALQEIMMCLEGNCLHPMK